LKPDQLKGAAEWIDSYRQFWEESFARFDEYLQQLKAVQGSVDSRNQEKTDVDGNPS